MPLAKFEKSTIKAIHTTVGPILKKIDDDIENFGGNQAQVNRIKKVIGLNERMVVDQTTTALDLCHEAALEIGGLADIDMILFVTQTPDHFQPGNAAILHGRLKLPVSCAAMDIGLGCSGWVYGLYLASLMIENGGCNKILLAAGDTMSRCVNPRDRSAASLFGDAGSATIIERSDQLNPTWFSLHTDGSGWENICIPAGGFRHPKTTDTSVATTDDDGNTRSPEDLFMNGAEVFNFSIKREPEAINEIIKFSKKSIEDIDSIVFHQANRYIIGNIARRLKISKDKTPCQAVEKYGNQSSASIPGAICDEMADSLLKETQQCIFSGFGVGLSWGTALTTIGPLDHCEISTYSNQFSD